RTREYGCMQATDGRCRWTHREPARTACGRRRAERGAESTDGYAGRRYAAVPERDRRLRARAQSADACDLERGFASRARTEGRARGERASHQELDGSEQTAHHSPPVVARWPSRTAVLRGPGFRQRTGYFATKDTD